MPRDSGESIFAARHQDVSQGPLGTHRSKIRVLRRFWEGFWGRFVRRVLRRGPAMRLTVKRVLRRVLRRGSEKSVSRKCLERPLGEYGGPP